MKALSRRTLTALPALTTLAALATAGCGTPPPASQVPDARSAIDRLHATQDCGLGVQADAKIDHFGEQGRVRGDLLMFALWPARLRMDVIGPMNVGVVATLTSDGSRFALADLREKRFYTGAARACNIARLTTVPMPGHVLVSLLRGDAPVLKHQPAQATIAWSRSGYYVVKITSTRDAEEELHLAPHPDDLGKPWQQQRMRVRMVEVRQQGIVLYHADLDGHEPGAMAKERVDPDGLDAPIPPSGPACHADLPKRIHVEVPGKDEDVLFRYDTVTWNPPVIEGLFTQPVRGGLEVVRVNCED
jgi:hypothetical protein